MDFFKNKNKEQENCNPTPSRRETIENFKISVKEEIEKQVAENIQDFSESLKGNGYTDEQIRKEIADFKDQMEREAMEMFKEKLVSLSKK